MSPRRPSLMARIRAVEPAPPWGVGAATVSILLAFVAIVAAVGFAGAWLGDRPSSLLAAWTLAGVLMVVFVMQSRRTPAERSALRLEPVPVPLPLLLVLNIGLAMLLDVVSLAVTTHFLPVPELMPLAQAPREPLVWLFAIVFAVVAQPLGEELVFRGIAQPALRAALGAWPGILLAALAYGVFHLAAYPPTYADVSQTTLLWYGLALPVLHGVVYGVNRAAAGSTRAAVVAHAAFGLFALLKVFIVVR